MAERVALVDPLGVQGLVILKAVVAPFQAT
jgi:hypothetical protein